MIRKIFTFTALVLSSVSAFAQQDAEAKKILDAVVAKYKPYNTIKTDFTITVDNQAGGVSLLQNGTLITQPKANKFKIMLYKGGTNSEVLQEIISDGKTQWTYLKTEKEVQVADVNPRSDNFNPAQLFTLYQKGYKYLFTGTQKISGKLYQIVDLTPEDIRSSFFKIRLAIDKTSRQIYSATLFDNGGGKYTYSLRTITPNAPATESTFAFDAKAHPGVEVVDLR